MPRTRVSSFLLAFLFSLSAYAASPSKDLLKAARDGNLAKVEDLLERGADKNAKTDDGTTALMLAVAGGHTEIVGTLLKAGANVNAANGSGKTALMAAAARGDTAGVLVLLEAGADVNAMSPSGETALKAAEMSRKTTVILILLEAGAEPLDETPTTPIPLAEPGVRVMRGAPHHRIIVPERPPIVDAAARGDVEAVRSLLDSGADVSEQESLLGLTALDMAKLEGHTEIVEILKKAGAKEKKP